MYSDQTGRFPITSAGGHKYTMVAVELDGSYIDAEPIQPENLPRHTNGFTPDGKPQELYAQIGTFSTTKHLKNF
jgi:hypothetical protein